MKKGTPIAIYMKSGSVIHMRVRDFDATINSGHVTRFKWTHAENRGVVLKHIDPAEIEAITEELQ